MADKSSRGTTVILADLRHDVCAALRLLLEAELGLFVIAEANDSDTLASCLNRLCPDVLVLDWALLEQGGLIGIVKSRCPHSRLIVLGTASETFLASRSIGADGFVSKFEPPDIVLSVLRSVL